MNLEHLNAATEFGRQLIKTQDLDPVYTALYRAKLARRTKARIIVAYSCLYHLGAACAIAERRDYWEALQESAINEGLKWPRGSERRHWRGQAAVKAAAYLSRLRQPPEALVEYWAGPKDNQSFSAVAKRVQEAPLYGPWIAFKVADLLERVMDYPIDFSNCAFGVYKEPRRAAALLLAGDAEANITDTQLAELMETLRKRLGKLKAPPSFNRPIGAQEVETVLCKYKSHVNGHYPVGKDTKEIRHALNGWGNLAGRVAKSLEAELA